MNSPSKKIKHKLDFNEPDEDHYLGIVTSEADYKISIILNQTLNIKLKNNEPVIKTIKAHEISFSRFTSGSHYTERSYDLVSNKKDKMVLIPRLPSIDYIFRIRGLGEKDSPETIARIIRSASEVTGVFVLDREKQLDDSVIELIP